MLPDSELQKESIALFFINITNCLGSGQILGPDNPHIKVSQLTVRAIFLIIMTFNSSQRKESIRLLSGYLFMEVRNAAIEVGLLTQREIRFRKH